jgi:hypothetical protein
MRSWATEHYSGIEAILMTELLHLDELTALCTLAVGSVKLLALYKKGITTEVGLHIHIVVCKNKTEKANYFQIYTYRIQ